MELEEHSQFFEIKEIHLPEDYRGIDFQYANDIALVELSGEVDITPWVLPVCVDWELDLPDLRPRELGTVVGFGNTPELPLSALNSVRLPVERSSTCRKLAPVALNVYSTQSDKFCVGFLNSSTVGQGDSGGGMAFPSEDRKWYLRGVVSIGNPRQITYSFFTNVTVFVPWMAKIINKGEVKGWRCGVDVSEASVRDGRAADPTEFPWEVDIYYRQAPSRGFERLWSGVLVSPHLVISTTLQMPPEGLHIDISVYPPAWIRVATRTKTEVPDLGQSSTVREVVRAYIADDMLRQHGVSYNLILLELKESINLMPVCLDWSGSALLHLKKTGTTFHELSNNTRVWQRYLILNEEECRERVREPPDDPKWKAPICVLQHESPHEMLDRGMQIYNPTKTFGGCHVKSKPLSPLEPFNFCTFQEGYDPPPLSRSLLVNVDNVWFLRGILSFSETINKNSVGMYTDFSNAEVLRWLTKTRDFMGKPTCGDVSLCTALSPGRFVRGHMPWTVAVVVNGVVKWSGLLVQPNAVITAIPDVPASNITILWQTTDGETKTSRVVQVIEHNTKGRYDLALLEIDPHTPVLNTPACLDLSGSVLTPLATGQLGLVESWDKWAPSNHSLVGVRSIDFFECFTKFQHAQTSYSKDRGFCTSFEKSTFSPQILGGAYLVYSGSKWFVQGLLIWYIKIRRENIVVALDFTDDGLRTWLRKKINKLQSSPWEIPDNSSPKNCEGAGPSSPHECGVFIPQDEADGGGEGGEDDYLTQSTLNRMPWNVNVYVDHGEGDLRVRAGTVVQPKMVLTSAIRLVDQSIDDASSEGRLALMPSQNVTVRYNTADSRNTLIVSVTAILVRKRTVPSWSVHYRYDMALLALETAVQTMPVCVPPPGSLGTTMPKLAAGSNGMVEVWQNPEHNYWHYLVPARVLTEEDCLKILPAMDNDVKIDIPKDEFCAKFVEENALKIPEEKTDNLPTDYGASFSVLSGGLWYLRGVLGINWRFHGGVGAQRTVFAFYNLDEPELLHWLHQRIGNTSAVPLPSKTTSVVPLASSESDTNLSEESTFASSSLQPSVNTSEARPGANTSNDSSTPLESVFVVLVSPFPTPSTDPTMSEDLSTPTTYSDGLTFTQGNHVMDSQLVSMRAHPPADASPSESTSWTATNPGRSPGTRITYKEVLAKSEQDENAVGPSSADRSDGSRGDDHWKQTATWLSVAVGVLVVVIVVLLAVPSLRPSRSITPALELTTNANA